MASIRSAFWNVENLFEPGTVDRGPGNVDELERKTRVLAEVLNGAFDGLGIDLVGLAEIGSRRILEELSWRLDAGPYLQQWQEPRMPGHTGLGLLARAGVFERLQHIATQRPTRFSRPRAMIVRCEIAGADGSVIVAVNHWKSRRPSSTTLTDSDDREQTADWLGQQLSRERRNMSVVVIGDFNAEPDEPLFGELRLRAGRTFSHALARDATPAYLYNASWKFLTEPDPWEAARQPRFQESRPKTSQGQGQPRLYDQLLVSGGVLRNGALTLREKSVQFLCLDGVTSLYSSTGVLEPLRWRYDAGEHRGASDHFPLLAEFDLN